MTPGLTPEELAAAVEQASCICSYTREQWEADPLMDIREWTYARALLRLADENTRLRDALAELHEEVTTQSPDSPQSMRMAIRGWGKRLTALLEATDED